MRTIILASESIRRKDILDFLGLRYEAIRSDFPEEAVEWSDFDDPHDFVRTIAYGKVLAIADKYPDALVLGADTSVFLDGKNFGKPTDLDDARRILSELRGRTHQVVTSVVMMDTLTATREIISVETNVEFLNVSDEQLESYIETSEPLGKAGAYAIQQGAGKFVKNVRGSLSNVVGLPIEETADLFEQFGIPLSVDVKQLVTEHFTFRSG